MSFEECFKDVEDEETAAECVHCLKKYGEQVIYSDELGRLMLGRELYDHRFDDDMKKLTIYLNIRNRSDYELMDSTYNLTMY
ncbi:MAG: hypothetical protein ACP5UV_00765 [Thermoplasmata archaeon]